MGLSPGTKLDRFEIVSLLGRGGMGEVWRARDAKIGRDVAIKVLLPEFAENADRLKRFELEVKAAGRLSHPNIVAIHDAGTFEGQPYVVSELVEGETLRERLGRGALPPRKAVEMAAQVARGLAAAHAKGIVHRDLKPENIVLTRESRAQILDFGLAKLADPAESDVARENARTKSFLTGAGLVVGTAGYMSPEQVRGLPVDHRSDVFCLGAILYEAVTGLQAFPGDSAADAMSAVLKDEPPGLDKLPATAPRALESILRHCLEKSPDDRYQSTLDLAFALESLLGPTETALPSTDAGPVLAPAPRRRFGAGGALVLAAAVAAALAGGFLAARSLRKGAAPLFHQLTFRRGHVKSARFSPDGGSIVYAAAWDGHPVQTYAMRPERPESREVGAPATEVLSVSRAGELLVSKGRRFLQLWQESGTLARLPLEGGETRDVLDDVSEADFDPEGKNPAVVHLVSGKCRLEYPPGKVLYETAGFVSQPRFSPDGKLIAFLDHPTAGDDAGAAAVVDLAGKKHVLSDGWISAAGLAWSPSGREVWFTGTTAGASRALQAVTLDGKRRTVFSVPGTLTLRDISASGRVLLALEKLRLGIVAGHPAGDGGDRGERDLSFLDWSHARDLSRDGRVLLFDETAEGGGAANSVYVRRIDGSAPVRLGDGAGRALSPDGKWVVANLPVVPKQLLLLPTGAGEPRALTKDAINHLRARFFPDGKRFLFAGAEAGRGVRLYVQGLDAPAPKAISPEGVGPFDAISPDGRAVAAIDPDGKLVLYAVDAGQPREPRSVPGAQAGDVPVSFSLDGRFLFVRSSPGVPARVERIDVASGARSRWVEMAPEDAAGVEAVTDVLMTPDATTYAFSYLRILSDLFVVDGLK
ncbi:MAG TPA: protein kinase [Thermoanaerobaculia bacterium]|nr:protein kinase [Thermoanaerobaculia bacterium]